MFLLPSAIGAIQQDPIRRIFKQASLDLQFAEKKSLVDATTGAQLVTFTRASSGTFVGSDGLLRSAVTNLLLRSEEFQTTWTATRASVTADAAIAPNGTTTADKLVEDSTASNTHSIRQAPTTTVSLPHALSIYVKAAERSIVAFEMVDNGATGNGISAYFNLGTDSISNVTSFGNGSGASAVMSNVGDGWYRCVLSGVVNTSGTAIRCNVYLSQAAGSVSYTGDGTSGLFLWGAQLEQSSTVGEYIPTTSTINSAPRFDHNPVTGESLGLLVEEARTNSIRNSTGVGAVAGTPGTVPTNWSVAAAAGLTTNVIGTGTSQGVTYVDLQVTGTSNATSYILAFDATTQIAATAGQSWSWSSWLAFVSGSLSDISTVSADFRESNSGGTQLAAGTVALSTLTSNLVRLSATRVLSEATTAFVQPRLRLTITNGAAIDITLRIGLPQLEQGAFATSTILTSTATVTRAADVASINQTNATGKLGFTSGTIYGQAARFNNATGTTTVFQVDDGTATNRVLIGTGSSGVAAQTYATTIVGGVNVASFGVTALSSNKFAFSYQADSYLGSFNGGLDIATSGAMPVINQAIIGSNRAIYFNGTIARICAWPQPLPGSTLQAITG